MIRLFRSVSLLVLLSMWSAAVGAAQESFQGSFAEPADGGNLDVTLSRFDGAVAYLVPRGHESEALGSGTSSRRWRNLLFAIRGVKGKIVTFRLPMRPPESGVMVHNMDVATFNLLEPVWSYAAPQRQWQAFTQVDYFKPDAANTAGTVFPQDSVIDNSGSVNVSTASARAEDFGWEFKNTTPFTEDVVYVSVNEHFPVLDFYGWLERTVLPHAWVQPTASATSAGSHVIGRQAGAPADGKIIGRDVPDLPLYAFKIQDPSARPTKLALIVNGQHPYEGQTKATLQAALQWILDPQDPAAAAYRAEYVTLVYPFVNPTGEYAGLWRGTARGPSRDPNRNWHTTLTDPAADPGIDTVIIHKRAMQRDVAAIGLGAPHVMLDLHQNYGDRMPALDYALHATNAMAAAYLARLQRETAMAAVVSNPANSQTLRGYWTFAGAGMAITLERATYSTLEREREFGRAMMRALAPEVVAPPAAPLPESPAPVEPEPMPAPPPATDEPAPTAPVGPAIHDTFGGTGSLNSRLPDTATSDGARWFLQQGGTAIADGLVTTSASWVRAFIDAGATDVAVQATLALRHSSGFAGLTLRSADRNTFYYFRVKTGGWHFGRITGSTAMQLAAGERNIGVNTFHTLRAECVGGEIRLHVGGDLVHTANVAADAAATHVGFTSGTAVSFAVDDFRVEALAGKPTVEPGPQPGEPTPVTNAGAYVFDSFSLARGLAGHRPEISATGATWTLAQGKVALGGGVATSTNAYVRAFVDAGVSDGVVEGRFLLPTSGAFAGLSLRAAHRDSYLFFRMKPGGWSFGVSDGSARTLASGKAPVGVEVFHTLRAECRGNVIALFLDGRLVHTAINAFNQQVTAFGVNSGTGYGFVVDDFFVGP